MSNGPRLANRGFVIPTHLEAEHRARQFFSLALSFAFDGLSAADRGSPASSSPPPSIQSAKAKPRGGLKLCFLFCSRCSFVERVSANGHTDANDDAPSRITRNNFSLLGEDPRSAAGTGVVDSVIYGLRRAACSAVASRLFKPGFERGLLMNARAMITLNCSVDG